MFVLLECAECRFHGPVHTLAFRNTAPESSRAGWQPGNRDDRGSKGSKSSSTVPHNVSMAVKQSASLLGGGLEHKKRPRGLFLAHPMFSHTSFAAKEICAM